MKPKSPDRVFVYGERVRMKIHSICQDMIGIVRCKQPYRNVYWGAVVQYRVEIPSCPCSVGAPGHSCEWEVWDWQLEAVEMRHSLLGVSIVQLGLFDCLADSVVIESEGQP